MGKLLVINGSRNEPLTWDPSDAEQTAEAAAKFMTLQRQGAVMAEGHGAGVEATLAKDFNPAAEEILAIKNQAGG